MSKSNLFSGQPIFNQLLSYVPRHQIGQIASDFQADKYYKNFRTYEHLVTQLYAIFNQCSSLRDVVTGLLAWESRIKHLGISYQPRKSTFADANQNRSSEVFEKIYNFLFARYSHFLTDSRSKKKGRQLFIVDSTTISLFHDILLNAGRPAVSGKRKGGIKVHTMIDSEQDVPCLVRMTAASAADVPFLKQIHMAKGSVLVMDRGYVMDYSQLNRLDKEGVTWVSRLRLNSVYQVIEKNQVTEFQKRRGVVSDHTIRIGHSHHDKGHKVVARLIVFRDSDTQQTLQFITNNLRLTSTQIATYYKRRWQIELLFKRIKQNYPLKSFLGESENAIRIQVWCALIADLIIKLIKANAGRKWSFSNLCSTIRIHLMTYINIYAFLRNPEKALIRKSKVDFQPSLFNTS
jgi:Transposase DDE domain/Domain of unknown function (DUF4372)